jgi:hypothetical protein
VPFGTAFADAVDDRDDCMLGPGDMDRAGTDGGGPGSAVAGDLRWVDLCDVVGACISKISRAERFAEF